MSIIVSPKFKTLKMRLAIFYLGLGALLSYSFLVGLAQDRLQQAVFPFSLLICFLFFHKTIFRIPWQLFVLAFAIWLGLAFRVQAMRSLGYFDDRIIVGRVTSDERGYNARRLYSTLQLIGKTYSLPGPALLPVSEDFDPKGWFSIKGDPAMVLFEGEAGFRMYVPMPKHWGRYDAASKARVLDIPGIFDPILLPPLPSSFLLPKEPEYAMMHYVSWVSGFFSDNINVLETARHDVLFEAAALTAPWRNGIPRALVRLLLAYESVVGSSFSDNPRDISETQNRLYQVSEYAKIAKDIDLLFASRVLAATTLLFQYPSVDDFSERLKKAREMLLNLLENPDLSESQKNLILQNLSSLPQR